jgi:hypothetical protein
MKTFTVTWSSLFVVIVSLVQPCPAPPFLAIGAVVEAADGVAAAITAGGSGAEA